VVSPSRAVINGNLKRNKTSSVVETRRPPTQEKRIKMRLRLLDDGMEHTPKKSASRVAESRASRTAQDRSKRLRKPAAHPSRRAKICAVS